LHATSAYLPSTSRLRTSMDRLRPTRSESASLPLYGPTAYEEQETLLGSTSGCPEVSRKLASLPGSHARRVWLPSQRVFQSPAPWKPLSAPDALGLRPPELSSFQVIEGRFPFPSPFLHFLAKPHDLASVLQRLHPTWKAAPLSASRRFNPGRGRLLSWAFQPLGLSLAGPP
jgi:hypothetical protein